MKEVIQSAKVRQTCNMSRYTRGLTIYLDVQELVASLGDPLGSQSDNDPVQSRTLETGNDDAVSRAIYISTALYIGLVWSHNRCLRSVVATTN